jgi:hypothetical protein
MPSHTHAHLDGNKLIKYFSRLRPGSNHKKTVYALLNSLVFALIQLRNNYGNITDRIRERTYAREAERERLLYDFNINLSFSLKQLNFYLCSI